MYNVAVLTVLNVYYTYMYMWNLSYSVGGHFVQLYI